MADYSFIHACRLAGKKFPEGFLDALMKDNSCAGVAIIEGSRYDVTTVDGNDYLFTYLQNEPAMKTDVENLLAEYPDKDCILSFGKGPSPFPQDDVQPYVALFNTEGETTLAVFTSGKGFEKYKSPNSSQYEAFSKLILPHIITAGKTHDDAADETFTDLASNPTMATLMNMIAGEDGWITIVSNEGQNTWSGGTKRNDYDFGWTTDACGWTDKTTVKPKATGFGGRPRPDGLKADPKTATSQVALQGATDEKTVANPDGVQGTDWDYWSPPSTWTKDQKRKAYANADRIDGTKGIVPDGYKDCPKIKIRLKKIEEIPPPTPRPVEVVSSNVNTIVDDELPVISAKSMGYLKNTFAKKGHVQATMSQGKVIVDPKRIERMTNDEWPTFVEKAGIEGLEDVKQALFYSNKERFDLITNTPDAAAALLGDVSLLAVQLLQQLDQIGTPAGAAAAAKHTAAKEILKPVVEAAKKASGFGKRR